MARKIIETRNKRYGFFYKVDTLIYQFGDKVL